MKIYLFGGAEVSLGQVVPELKLIESIINGCDTRQILHVPFARLESDKSESEWRSGWFDRNIKLEKAQYLNAENNSDIEKADHPLVFISGGRESIRLYNKITENKLLFNIIKSASVIVAESAGAKVLGEYMMGKGSNIEPKLVKGLGILPNTIIEPHYTERKRQQQLKDELQQSGMKYGVGIDALTGMEFELKDFPNKYKVIGEGKVEII